MYMRNSFRPDRITRTGVISPIDFRRGFDPVEDANALASMFSAQKPSAPGRSGTAVMLARTTGVDVAVPANACRCPLPPTNVPAAPAIPTKSTAANAIASGQSLGPDGSVAGLGQTQARRMQLMGRAQPKMQLMGRRLPRLY